jgi:hypothetical protein
MLLVEMHLDLYNNLLEYKRLKVESLPLAIKDVLLVQAYSVTRIVESNYP